MKKFLWIVAGIVVAAFVVGGIASSMNGGTLQSDRPTVSFTQPLTEPTHDVTEPTQAAPEAPAEQTEGVGEGMWAVGPDIPAGTYRTAGATDSMIPNCYWERLRDSSGDFSAIIANGNVTATHTVTINDGEWFNSTGCQPWVKIG